MKLTTNDTLLGCATSCADMNASAKKNDSRNFYGNACNSFSGRSSTHSLSLEGYAPRGNLIVPSSRTAIAN